jgi:hypothetical protein
MKKLFGLFSLSLLLSAEPGYTQPDSVLSYMPLDIGNQWQYKVHYIVYGPPHTDTTTYYSVSMVERDTTMPNGYQYQVLKNASEAKYIHIDSTTACVYEYEGNSSRGLKTDSLRCSEGDLFGRGSLCDFIEIASVLNHQTWIMGISRPRPDITVSHTLAMDLGIIYQYVYKSFGWGREEIYTLVYAKINGVEYGELVNSTEDISNRISSYTLHQNFPNPFNPITTINYDVPERSLVSLKIYDVLGNEIATVVDEEKIAGEYEIVFNSETLPSGVYFYQLKVREYVETKKMVLMK